jgi:hypothetical protein
MNSSWKGSWKSRKKDLGFRRKKPEWMRSKRNKAGRLSLQPRIEAGKYGVGIGLFKSIGYL